MLSSTLTSLLLALPLVSSHFLLNYPPTIGFDDDKEGTSPCGSFDISSRTTVTEFPISGGPIALTSTHPEAVWVFRAALLNDTTNFVDIIQPLDQTGQGAFCETAAQIPASWAGLQGVLQILQDAADGVLYQCAAVNFTAGAFSGTLPAKCSNLTGLTATYTSVNLASIITSTAPAAAASTGSATTTAPAPASTTSKGAADRMWASNGVLVGGLLVAAAMV